MCVYIHIYILTHTYISTHTYIYILYHSCVYIHAPEGPIRTTSEPMACRTGETAVNASGAPVIWLLLLVVVVLYVFIVCVFFLGKWRGEGERGGGEEEEEAAARCIFHVSYHSPR